MAMTAWSAKVLSSSTCVSAKSPGFGPRRRRSRRSRGPRAASARRGRLRKPAASAASCIWYCRVRQHVRDMDDCPVTDRARGRRSRGSARIGKRPTDGSATPAGSTPWSAARWISSPSNRETTADSASQSLHRALGDDVEDRLDVGRRARDDAQDLAGRRLLLQRLGEVAVAASSSVNSRTFSMAITAWSANVLSRSICRSGNSPASGPRDDDRSDRDALPQHRDRHDAPVAHRIRRPRRARSRGPPATSGMCATAAASRIGLAAALPGPAASGRRAAPPRPPRSRVHAEPRSGGARPSNRKTHANSAPQSRAALWAIVSNTGWTSVGELQMTRRISLVAVCCSSVSVRSRFRASSSLNRRTFSMAMTAWSAKVFRSSICVVGERPGLRRAMTVIAPIGTPVAQHRHAEQRSGSPPARRDCLRVLGILAVRPQCGRRAPRQDGAPGRMLRGSAACGIRLPEGLERLRCCSRRWAAKWISSPSKRKTEPYAASHRRTRALGRSRRRPAGRRSASWR